MPHSAKTRTSRYAADYTALSTEDLLALYQHNLNIRNTRRDAESAHMHFDWDSGDDQADEQEAHAIDGTKLDHSATWGREEVPEPAKPAEVEVERDHGEVARWAQSTRDSHDAEAEAMEEARRALARAARIGAGNTNREVATQMPTPPVDADIASDWVVVDLAEREVDLGQTDLTSDPVRSAPADATRAASSQSRPKKAKTKSAPPNKPPFALYGWRSDSTKALKGRKMTYNIKAAANINPASRRAGVRRGLLPQAADDNEVHEHAHRHAHPDDGEDGAEEAVAVTAEAPREIPPNRRPQVRHERRVEVPRLGLKVPRRRRQKMAAPTAAEKVEADADRAVNETEPVRHQAGESVTARLNALLSEEARTRRSDWRTEYTDYYETTARQYPRRAFQRQAYVQSAHAPAGVGGRRPPRFFDLNQTVDKHTRSERREMEESGVQHPKPWLGTSPGKWKASAGPDDGAKGGASGGEGAGRPPRRAVQPPHRPPSQHASPFFRHLDVIEQSALKHPAAWKAASPGRWQSPESGGVGGGADGGPPAAHPSRPRSGTYTLGASAAAAANAEKQEKWGAEDWFP